MTKYRIYAGLSGGFGGANNICTEEFHNRTEAEEFAYQQALEKYVSYEGSHGILSYDECRAVLEDSYSDDEIDEEWVCEYYSNEVESWVEYWVEEET